MNSAENGQTRNVMFSLDPMRALTLTALLVAGCATTAPVDIEGAKISWHGAHYDEVVSRWGPPGNHTTLTDGRDVYAWDSESVAPRARIYPSIGIFGGSGGLSIGTGIGVGSGGGELVRCNRMLVFRDARIVEQMWQGDPGFCDSFRR